MTTATRAELDAARARTKSVYERHAAGWDRRRPKVFYERSWLERFCRGRPTGGRVLDLGCGAGDPISGWFVDQGYALTGADYAEPMLEIARQRYPAADWILADMRELPDIGTFDGVISWDAFFHLDADDQHALLDRLAHLLRPGGVLLLTVGPEASEVIGHVEGEAVYHASLSPAAYEASLREAGFVDISLTAHDATIEDRSVLFATRS